MGRGWSCMGNWLFALLSRQTTNVWCYCLERRGWVRGWVWLVWVNISKALVRSIILVNVWSGGRGWLKPWAILCARGRRVDTLEWLGRKPCWLGERGSELSCRRHCEGMMVLWSSPQTYMSLGLNVILLILRNGKWWGLFTHLIFIMEFSFLSTIIAYNLYEPVRIFIMSDQRERVVPSY